MSNTIRIPSVRQPGRGRGRSAIIRQLAAKPGDEDALPPQRIPPEFCTPAPPWSSNEASASHKEGFGVSSKLQSIVKTYGNTNNKQLPNTDNKKIPGHPSCKVSTCGPFGCATSCIYIDDHKDCDDDLELPHHDTCTPEWPTDRHPCTECLSENEVSLLHFMQYVDEEAKSHSKHNWPDPSKIRLCECHVKEWKERLTDHFPTLEVSIFKDYYFCHHCTTREKQFMTVDLVGRKLRRSKKNQNQHTIDNYTIRVAKAACRRCNAFLFLDKSDDEQFEMSIEYY